MRVCSSLMENRGNGAAKRRTRDCSAPAASQINKDIPETHHARGQLPLALGPLAEPEPDLAVVPGTIDDYRNRHPGAAVLVVEIADTSLEFDRTRMAEMYARSEIPEYWILNLVDHQLVVFREPRENRYGVHLMLGADSSISPLAAPEARLQILSLLP